MPDELGCLLDHLIDVELHHLRLGLLREVANPPDHFAGPTGVLDHIGDARLGLREVGNIAAQQPQNGFRVGDDRGQRLIYLMRDRRAHLAKRGHARDVGELSLGGLQRALGPLLIVDVVSRRVPSNHLSVLIAERYAAAQEPAIFSVSSADALLQFERLACGQVSAPGGFYLREVIRMDRDRPPFSLQAVLRETGISSPGLIEELGRPIASMSHHDRRDGIDCQLKLSFGLPLQLEQSLTLLLCSFAILYVQAESVPPGDVALLVHQWHTASPKPAIFPIRSSAETRLVLEWLAVSQAGTPQFQPALEVFGMYPSLPPRAFRVLRGKPGIVHPASIHECRRAVRQSSHRHRRHCFDQIAKLPFTTS